MLSPDDIQNLRIAGEKTIAVFAEIKKHIKPGVSLIDIDKIAEETVIRLGATPAFKGYQGYPNSICASLNEEIVHCIPDSRVLKEGDVITIDFGVKYKGVNTDCAITWPVGVIDVKVRKLLSGTYQALRNGVEQAKVGNVVDDISFAIQQVLCEEGLTIFREFVGHEVGKTLHGEILIPNFKSGDKTEIKSGMVFAIEPIAGIGDDTTINDTNGWNWKAKDLAPVAHFEETVLITDQGPEIITPIESLIGS